MSAVRTRRLSRGALSVGHARELAWEQALATAALAGALLDGGDGDARRGFDVAWNAAKCAAGTCVHTQALIGEYGEVMDAAWRTRTTKALTALIAIRDAEPVSLLRGQARMLQDLSELLGELEGVLRDVAVTQLGSGEAVSDSDLAALLAGS